MNNKRKWLFRGCAVLAVLLIAALMFLVGRGHTVYIDNKTLEYNGETYEALQKSEVWVGGERLSKLAKRERTMSTVIGQSFEMNLINTVNKGDDPTETTEHSRVSGGTSAGSLDDTVRFRTGTCQRRG